MDKFLEAVFFYSCEIGGVHFTHTHVLRIQLLLLITSFTFVTWSSCTDTYAVNLTMERLLKTLQKKHKRCFFSDSQKWDLKNIVLLYSPRGGILSHTKKLAILLVFSLVMHENPSHYILSNKHSCYNFSISGIHAVLSHYGFDLYFLTTSDIKQIFTCPLATHVFLYRVSVHIFAH